MSIRPPSLTPSPQASLPWPGADERCPKCQGRGEVYYLRAHQFRATGITAYLEAGGTLENAQAMAAHESPRTTKLYDRTGDELHSMKSSGFQFRNGCG
jgi:integrase